MNSSLLPFLHLPLPPSLPPLPPSLLLKGRSSVHSPQGVLHQPLLQVDSSSDGLEGGRGGGRGIVEVGLEGREGGRKGGRGG